MDEHGASTLWGHVFIFLTTVSGFVFAWFREARQHRWQLEQFDQVKRDIKNGHG